MCYKTLEGTNIKLRSFYWDNCKGFLMILVVFAHFLIDLREQHNLNNLIVIAIYMFHMPAFVFVSGYFSKSDHSRSLRSILLLGVTYFLYTAGFIFFNLYQGIPELTLSYPYYSAWYILSLIIWRLITPYIEKIRGIVFFLIVFSVLSGYWTEFDLKYTAVKVIVFFPFFMAGYNLQPDTLNKIQQYVSNKRIASVILMLCVAIACGVFTYRYFNITIKDLLPNYYQRQGLQPAFARFSVLVTAGLCIAAMLCIFIEKQIPLLTKIGKNSLSVYLLHRPVTLWFSGMVLFNSEQEQIVKACVCTFLVIIVFGSDFVSDRLKSFLNICVDALLGGGTGSQLKYSVCRILLFICLFEILALPALSAMEIFGY